MNSILDESKQLRSLGFNTIAMKWGTKQPTGPFARQRRAKVGISALPAIFGSYRVNLGLVCGITSNHLFVIDCDTLESFAYVIAKLSELDIVTWTRTSPRGGHIYLLLLEGAAANQGFSKNSPVEEQYQILGQDSLVMVAPSVHPDTGEILVMHKPTPLPASVSLEEVRFLGVRLHSTSSRFAGKVGLPELADRIFVRKDTTGYATNSHAERAGIMSLHSHNYTCNSIMDVVRLHKPPHYMKMLKEHGDIKGDKHYQKYMVEAAIAKSNYQGSLLRQETYQLMDDVDGSDLDPIKKSILQALLKRRIHVNLPEFRATVRELAVGSGRCTVTVSKVMKEFTADGVLILVKKSRVDGNTYSVSPEMIYTLCDVSRVRNNTMERSSYTALSSVLRLTLRGTDAGHRNALGPTGDAIYCWVQRNPGLGPKAIQQGTGISDKTVDRKLRMLVESGYLTNDLGKYSPVMDFSPTVHQEAALRYGTAGSLRKKMEMFKQERETLATQEALRNIYKYGDDNPELRINDMDAEHDERLDYRSNDTPTDIGSVSFPTPETAMTTGAGDMHLLNAEPQPLIIQPTSYSHVPYSAPAAPVKADPARWMDAYSAEEMEDIMYGPPVPIAPVAEVVQPQRNHRPHRYPLRERERPRSQYSYATGG